MGERRTARIRIYHQPFALYGCAAGWSLSLLPTVLAGGAAAWWSAFSVRPSGRAPTLVAAPCSEACLSGDGRLVAGGRGALRAIPRTHATRCFRGQSTVMAASTVAICQTTYRSCTITVFTSHTLFSTG